MLNMQPFLLFPWYNKQTVWTIALLRYSAQHCQVTVPKFILLLLGSLGEIGDIEHGSFCMAFTVHWDFWLATFSLTRGFAWQAQYFVTGWRKSKIIKVSGFLGVQVNTARFAWHLQCTGTSDWLLSVWRVVLRGRHYTLWPAEGNQR